MTIDVVLSISLGVVVSEGRSRCMMFEDVSCVYLVLVSPCM
jgi:hypothetical protein